MYPPPFPEGGGSVCLEAPRGRNFIPPPLFVHPSPLESGVGGVGVCKKFGPASICIFEGADLRFGG